MSARPSSGLLWCYLAAVTALIAYASLYPFDFDFSRFGAAMQGGWWQNVMDARSGNVDIIANLLFYVPFGFVLLVLLDRRTTGSVLLALLCVPLGALLSFGMELLQFAVPRRDPSIVDIVLNSIGTLVGAFVAVTARVLWKDRPALALLRQSGRDPVPWLLLVCWVVLKAAPFMPRMGLYGMRQAIAPLRDLQWTMTEFAAHLAGYVLMLSALRCVIARAKFWPVALLLSLGTLICQVLVVSHDLSLDEVSACVTALLLTGVLRNWRTERTMAALFLIVLGLIVLSGLAPFQFSTSPRPFRWLPFSATLELDAESGFAGIIKKILLYGGAWWAANRAGLTRIAATVTISITLISIEVAQMFLPGRVPEITDPLLLLALGLALSAPWLHDWSPPDRSRGHSRGQVSSRTATSRAGSGQSIPSAGSE
jgi:VanZ family protein